jgi:hypothetical protein
MADFAAPTYGLTAPLTQTLKATMPAATGTFTNAQLVGNTLPTGALKTFLSATTYTNDAAAETAFRNAGGIINIRQTGGTASPVLPTIAWKAASTAPTLDITIAGGASNEVLEVSITIPHSVIQ